MATKPDTADEFADAFAAFAQDATPANDAEPAPVVEEAVPAAADPAPAVEAAPKADPSDADGLIDRLNKVLQERPVEAPARPQAAEPTETEVYSADEKEFLVKYEEDWTDVSRGEELKRRAEYRSLVGFVFNQVAEQFRPISDAVEVLAGRAQLTDLRTKIENYDDVRDNVIDWVGGQPTYLQAAYNSVIQAGTPDEVADLVARFRKETGTGVPVQVTTPKKTELSDATKKAVETLAPVSTKRSAVPQAEDDGDFDSAFARFAEVLKR